MYLVKIFNNKMDTIYYPPDTFKKSPKLFRPQIRSLVHRDLLYLRRKKMCATEDLPEDLPSSSASQDCRTMEASWSHLLGTVPLPPCYFSIN